MPCFKLKKGKTKVMQPIILIIRVLWYEYIRSFITDNVQCLGPRIYFIKYAKFNTSNIFNRWDNYRSTNLIKQTENLTCSLTRRGRAEWLVDLPTIFWICLYFPDCLLCLYCHEEYLYYLGYSRAASHDCVPDYLAVGWACTQGYIFVYRPFQPLTPMMAR